MTGPSRSSLKNPPTVFAFLAGFASCALLVLLFGGSRVEWRHGDGGSSFDFHISSLLGGWEFLGGAGLLVLVLGAAFLATRSRTVNAAGGAPTATVSDALMEFLRQLTRSNTDCWIGGVCGGLGRHTPVPSWVWRLTFVVALLGYGVGVLAYVLLWIFVPAPGPAAAANPVSDPAENVASRSASP